jgi:hypothetical protein
MSNILYPLSPGGISCLRKPFQTAKAAFWESDGKVVPPGFCMSLATPASICELNKSFRGMPFKGSRLEKSWKWLQASQGLLTSSSILMLIALNTGGRLLQVRSRFLTAFRTARRKPAGGKDYRRAYAAPSKSP